MQNVISIFKKLFFFPHQLIKQFGFFMQSVVNFIILIPVYFIGIGIMSLVSKIMKKSYLNLSKKKKKSYWLKRDKRLDAKGTEYRMF